MFSCEATGGPDAVHTAVHTAAAVCPLYTVPQVLGGNGTLVVMQY